MNFNEMFNSKAQQKNKETVTSFTADSSKKTLLNSNANAKTAIFDFCICTALYYSETETVNEQTLLAFANSMNVQMQSNHNVVKHARDNVLEKKTYASKVLAYNDDQEIYIKSDSFKEKLKIEMSDKNSKTREQIKTYFKALNTALEQFEKQATEQKQTTTTQQKTANERKK